LIDAVEADTKGMMRQTFHILAMTVAFAAAASAQTAEKKRVAAATTAFEEIMSAPDKGVPRSVLDRAEAIIVVPSVLKGGFVLGAHRGKGIVSVRDPDSRMWSAPAFLTLVGGSVGAQIGGQAVDVVLIVMNRRGVETLLGNQFKFGADAAVAAGPVGRDAEASTDAQLRAEILSYSRARGLFVGVTLKGSALREDVDANEHFYGKPYSTRQIVFERLGGAPAASAAWRDLLTRHAG
jgi:lipid-binding SYLF domain-containing protein